VTYTYDKAGQLLTVTNANGAVGYTYDRNGHVTRVQKPGGQIFYTYDLAGNQTQANGVVAANSYTYDALNRLRTVSESKTGLTSYSYDNVGNLQSVTYPNSVVHNYTYDNRNRLTNLGVNGKVGGASGVIASYAYTLDAAGHRTAVAELSGRTVNYGYDTIYRLTSETLASDPSSCGTAIPGCAGGITGAVSYTYDAVGNRTQKTSTLPGFPGGGLTNYNANDQLATDAYDANGNTVGSGTNTGTNGYVYEFENRLIQQGGIGVGYDGNGNRVSKTVA
jgi:YD repeat-containing protein